ncbi:MAG: restriction endonuclease subunit S [Gammaproteobacteria bacterium]|nr:restriction endonuclease subunit S [Gammaproteobacteria bacterium]
MEKRDIFAANEDSRLPQTNWNAVTIAEIAEKVGMGPFGSSIKVETFVPNGVPIISGQHLHGSRLDDSQGYNFITEVHARHLANANVQKGDVILTHAGNIGQVAYIPDRSQYNKYVISQRQFYLRCDQSKVIPEYVTAYFNSPEGRHKLLANASQVGVPAIAQPVSYLRTIDIPLPSLNEQRAIAHILGTLDDKIELNQRMNETLESMAYAIFKDWFIDFGLVRAKMERRLTEFPREITELFPDSLDHSGMPVGWSKVPLKKIGSIVTGKTPSTRKPNYFGNSMPFLKIPDMRKRIYVLRTSVGLSDEGVYTQANKTVPAGSISVSCIATPGLVVLNHRATQTNQQINTVVPSDLKQSHFVFWSCRQLANLVKIGGVGGSVFQNMNKKTFENLEFVYPGKKIARIFSRHVSKLHERILAGEHEIDTLTQLRQTLLPKLISGEIRVTDAESGSGLSS